jgi:hypothetical protein
LIEKRNVTHLTETEHFIIEILEHRKDKLKLVEIQKIDEYLNLLDSGEIDSVSARKLLEL